MPNGYFEPERACVAFESDAMWLWGASVVKGDDGLYHMFVSAWPIDMPFAHCATNSQVIHAVAEKPVGPFRYADVALGGDDNDQPGKWHGRVYHDPIITRHGGQYLLYFAATSYTGARGSAPAPIEWATDRWCEAWSSFRSGLAVADSPCGPWSIREEPLVEPRKGHWDRVIISNPAPFVHEDGSATLVYKSIAKRYPVGGRLPAAFKLGVCRADHYLGEYRRLCEGPLFQELDDADFEDAYLLFDGSEYELVLKDMNGASAGEAGGGISFRSADALNWARPAKQWSFCERYEKLVRAKVCKLERPGFLLSADNRPTHAYLTLGTGVGSYAQIESSLILAFEVRC